MFLLGLYAGRRGIFQEIPAHRALFRRILWWGLAFGVSSQLAYVALSEGASQFEPTLGSFVANVLHSIGGPALALSYVAAFTLLLQRSAWHQRFRPIAAVGRMALSNYLLQSLVATTLLYGYGFGLFGQVGPALGLLITIAIFLAQIPLSVWWLRHFQFGPVEWLWRSLTYLRPQALRYPVA